jgi:hypothetical protein
MSKAPPSDEPPPRAGGTQSIDKIGAGRPCVELSPLAITGGLLAAAARGEQSTFDRVAHAAFEDGWAVVDLGAPSCIWPRVTAECEQSVPMMQPGRSSRPDGTAVEGISPSGAPRGDVFVALSTATEDTPLPALALLDTALAIVGVHLSASLERLVGRPLHMRTDPFLACFPGEGAGYGAHFDGGGGSGRLTMILYLNPGWSMSAHEGALEMYDEPSRCWRAVAPVADRLVIFRADDVLHRVGGVHGRRRYAMTAWWSFSPNHEPALPSTDVLLLRSHYAVDDPRRAQRFRLVPHSASELLQQMQWMRPAPDIEALVEENLNDL